MNGRKLLLIAAAVLLAILIGGKVWYSQALRPTGTTGQSAVTVTSGESVVAIAADLSNRKLIRSSFAFKLHVRFNRLAAKFQAGRYVVSGQRSTPAIAAELTDSAGASNQFTIKEGRTQKQIAAQLGPLGIIDEPKFAGLKARDFSQYDFLANVPAGASLEGFLFPETYSVPPPGTSTEDVAATMLNQFGKELTPELRTRIAASGRSIFEMVTVASILEEEVRTDRDRRLVAGIVYKRLEQGIPLGLDTTLLYGLHKSHDDLTQSELRSDNPYNTRKFKGLPPGPISNPGLGALRAAINPEASDYLFYLSAPDGTTYYARTNAEQEANKAKYLK